VSGGFAMAPTLTISAATRETTVRRMDRRMDARWAPLVGTGKSHASSPPEHRAWGTVTVGYGPPQAWNGRKRVGNEAPW
jgi:hypothetical protein